MQLVKVPVAHSPCVTPLLRQSPISPPLTHSPLHHFISTLEVDNAMVTPLELRVFMDNDQKLEKPVDFCALPHLTHIPKLEFESVEDLNPTMMYRLTMVRPLIYTYA
ncbi:hypothetical protein EVAR_84329_1 [Eumeta japonica]|uniref:Uncharacterized protein n=1 Tax=Eumeta variegata TaxID=151549 RepID=A0A4C1U5S7_EUMVA|nr:hypothetical protein EVAR_84329_1 [Eumeta japonica]